MLNIPITDLEQTYNELRTKRNEAKDRLLEACADGRYEEVPYLTIRWKYYENEKIITKQKIDEARKR